MLYGTTVSADEPSLTSAQQRQHAQPETHRQRTRDSRVIVSRELEFRGPVQSGQQFHSWQPERNSERHLEVDVMTFCTVDLQNIRSYQNDLSARAWEGEQRPSIIFKINPPLHSSHETINNVAKGENLWGRFILIL